MSKYGNPYKDDQIKALEQIAKAAEVLAEAFKLIGPAASRAAAALETMVADGAIVVVRNDATPNGFVVPLQIEKRN